MLRDIGAAAPIMAVTITFLVPGGMSIADKPPEKKKSIKVAELQEMQVVGSLDHPFGEIVAIEGVVAGEDAAVAARSRRTSRNRLTSG